MVYSVITMHRVPIFHRHLFYIVLDTKQNLILFHFQVNCASGSLHFFISQRFLKQNKNSRRNSGLIRNTAFNLEIL